MLSMLSSVYPNSSNVPGVNIIFETLRWPDLLIMKISVA